jgi:low temperature requirement protein LtrA
MATRNEAGGLWLSPPRLRTTDEVAGERRATWLEIFFDLVFVVAITELAHELVVDHSAAGFLRFAALFVPVFVAWQGFSAYADRFDSDDLAQRVVFFVAMLAIAALAVLIDDVAHGANTAAFALAYVTLRCLMLALYARAWRAVPDARPLIRRYGLGYGSAVAVWLVSLAFDTPYRYVLWGVALALELSLPPLSTRLHRTIPTSSSHLPERWALFTMIVIGESIVAVAVGTADADWKVSSATAAVLGFAAGAAVWWLYFDNMDEVLVRGSSPAMVVYSYAHLPLLMALAGLGAGVRLLIDQAGADHLERGAAAALLGSLALFLASLVGTRSVTVSAGRRTGIAVKSVAVAVLAVIFGVESAVPPPLLAACAALVLAALVVVERTTLLGRSGTS